ncbi:T9SS type A sorting domain-containing protein [candidate division KSB1 bacterium]
MKTTDNSIIAAGRIIFLTAAVLLLLFLPALSAQTGSGAAQHNSQFSVNKAASYFDRGIAHLDKGKMKLNSFENFGMIGRRRPYSRHGEWGELRFVLLSVGMPPGPWGANVVTEDLGVIDRSNLYNVIENQSQGTYHIDEQGSSYTDWEAMDNALTRQMGGARFPNGRYMIAISDNPLSWPYGYYDDSETWIDTPDERHWPGPWVVDNNPASQTYGQELYGQFVSDRDIFFTMTDKYNGIREGYEGGVGVPIGIDVDVTGYSFAHPLYEDLVFLKYDILFREDIASEDPSRNFYDGTIDSVFTGFMFEPDLPGTDPQNYSASPWAIDDFAYIEKSEDAIFVFDKRGYTEDLGSPHYQGPVSVYSLAFLSTPEDRGITEYHYFDQEDVFDIAVGPHFEEVWYGVIAGIPGLMANDEERRLFFHADKDDMNYPHFDSFDSLITFNEFDHLGNPYPTFYQHNAEDRPDLWFTIGSGPFSMTPGETYPLHVVIFGSDDNPGALDPGYFDIPVNTPGVSHFGFVDPHDRFADVYDNLATAKRLYDHKFNGHFVQLNSLNNGGTVSGSVDILWDAASVTTDTIRYVDLLYSLNAGASWDTIAVDLPNTGMYTWDTTPLPDGLHYRVKVIARDSLFIGQMISAGDFTVNNVLPVPPEITLLAPLDEMDVTQRLDIRWYAGDPDGDPIGISIHYSPDDNVTWHEVVAGHGNTGLYVWNTWNWPNCPGGILRLIASDGFFADTVYTQYPVAVSNERTSLESELIEHTTGLSNENFSVRIVNPDALKRHRYEVTFDDTTNLFTTYTVRDMNTDLLALSGEQIYDVIEGGAFDGVRLLFDRHEAIGLLQSGWTVRPDTNWWNIASLATENYALPGYYELRYLGGSADSALESTSTMLKSPNKIIPFQIWNLNGQSGPHQVLIELSGAWWYPWYSGQTITFWEPDPANPDKLIETWITVISWPDSGDVVGIDTSVTPPETLYAIAMPPKPGDVYVWETTIPFTHKDTLRILLDLTPVEEPSMQIPSDYDLAQNYPNPFNATTTIGFSLPKREHVKIVVYDILGREVRELTNTDYAPGNHLLTWNGANASGIPVASGVYFYRIQAGSFVKSRKMVVLK